MIGLGVSSQARPGATFRSTVCDSVPKATRTMRFGPFCSVPGVVPVSGVHDIWSLASGPPSSGAQGTSLATDITSHPDLRGQSRAG